ncbi:DNA cross-link repair 1A protein [Trypanosoma rangeli]|uniref:Protein artemis n=1 Tax=Trypanosoma rangeli TaxID=5698 RepID=A0A3R7MJM0_TRYRA|nr:DNA cross-link repair 1A protein [Trypanosoma rangeli]RNF07040.1 DNA cross-link repair 1A protein [Trypanosoma rangeli]|eukprot:RNF07040.1 DNA cross-link repair 1A protein [Trypanosoma rangeli]
MQSTANMTSLSLTRQHAVAEYMRSREVYRNETVAVLVDAFRHTHAYTRLFGRVKDEIGLAGEIQQFRLLFFLSHFHSDHYSGITEGWNHGTIYASRSTANLLCWRLGLPQSRVKHMDFCVTYVFSLKDGALLYEQKEETEVEDCPEECFSVTLISAKHCPGAVMFLFRSTVFGTILHTGDFRFTQEKFAFSRPPEALQMLCTHEGVEMDKDPVLRSVAGKVDVLFLDNTFCDRRFSFLSRAESLREVNQAILSLFREHTSTLKPEAERVAPLAQEGKERVVSVAVFIGSYFIGKERIALSIQENFPLASVKDSKCRVVPTYVSPEKYEALRQLDYYLDHFVPFPRCQGAVKGESSTLETFTRHAVRLPQDTLSSSPEVARDVFSSFELAEMPCNEIVYYLTILLVPFSSVTRPALAVASGGRSKRQRDDSTAGDTHQDVSFSGESISLWGEEVVDLKQFDKVLCVEPTGWSRNASRQPVSKRVTLLRVPYSEHCSFTELVDFVEFLNPTLIVPTVSLELFKKYEVLFAEKAPRLRQRYANAQPLSRFLVPRQLPVLGGSDTKGLEDSCVGVIERRKQRNPFAPITVIEEVILIDGDYKNCSFLDSNVAQVTNALNENEVDRENEALTLRKDAQVTVATNAVVSIGNPVMRERSEKEVTQHAVGKEQMNTQISTYHRTRLNDVGANGSDDSDDCVCVLVRPHFIEVSDSSN